VNRASWACRNLPAQATRHILDVIREGIDVANTEGEFTEAWFDQHSIPDDEGREEKKEKDERAPHRRRTIMLTHQAFHQRLAEQARLQAIADAEKEEAAKKRTKAKAKREQVVLDEEKRKLALEHGPKQKRKDDAFCLLCPVSYYAYQDYGLVESHGGADGKHHVWKQCSGCNEWFCPTHVSDLTGKYGHETACLGKKKKPKGQS